MTATSTKTFITRSFFASGRVYEVMLETAGQYRGMVHLIDARKFHDPNNSDVLITGAHWNWEKGEIILGDADVYDEDARYVLHLASRILREALATQPETRLS